jgi:hypothetical protein
MDQAIKEGYAYTKGQCAHKTKELNPFLGGHLDPQVFKNLQVITTHKWFLKGGMD